ncbi:hypothetical protein BCR32DRAFT_296613 [Anaeromyces robustus]|uniref:Spindle pole body component n=1 Tax=Anaeromyces robustus TaxID=1754192 RepID=A0A1Y1WRH2_9FUNG|nr:hypothetical protein BCR32DRAFT_296613 [Anaeromyces robustus]|eukprot:ORX75866.1 hypothetical protein BCR32DRAFT_296613 [Anaeromyces robustus]
MTEEEIPIKQNSKNNQYYYKLEKFYNENSPFYPLSTHKASNSQSFSNPKLFHSSSFYDDETRNNSIENLPIYSPSKSDFVAPKNEKVLSDYKFSLKQLYPQHQEYLIIEDLFYVLLGFDGEYIYRIDNKTSKNLFINDEIINTSTNNFEISKDLDQSLKDLVFRILPLANYYTQIENFIETHSLFEYGQVNQAFSAAIRRLLQEYRILINQLEHQFHTSNTFSLQKLWYYIHPHIHTMATLSSLIEKIQIKESPFNHTQNKTDITPSSSTDFFLMNNTNTVLPRGGALLTLIHNDILVYSGDPITKKLYEFLLSYASVPYFKILKRWIYHGEIKDPSNEFMVEKKNIRKENLHEEFNDMYWEQCYTLREEAIPTFLASYKNKILAAGKYLNVIKEYKREETGKLLGYNFLSSNESIEKEGVLSKIPYMEADELMKTIGEGRYKVEIDLAYHSANKALIDLIFKEQHLIERLRSIKHYLFLDQSDFLTHFLDIASSELEKRSKDISLTKLQSLLDISLRNPSSVSSQDPYNENVKVEMSRCSLIEQLLKINSIVGVGVETIQQSVKDLKTYKQNWNTLRDSVKTLTENHTLTGFDAFTLNYSVKFPLTLILNMTAMTKYQLLFRHIFSCKYVEKRLAESWLLQSSSKINIWKGRKEKRAKDTQTTLLSLRIYSLRSKMLNFVQQFMYYVCFEVLEPNWVLMEQKIKKATTVEEVLKIHSDFQDTCLKECMLTTPNSLKIFNEIMMTCKKFVKFFEWCISDSNSSTTVMNMAPDDMDIDSYSQSQEDLTTVGESSSSIKISNRSHPLIILKHYEDNFLYHLKKLIDIFHFSTVESSIFTSLLTRLDYNQYYYHLQSLTIRPSTINMQLDSNEEKKGRNNSSNNNNNNNNDDDDDDDDESEEEEEEEDDDDENESSSNTMKKNKNNMDLDSSQYSSISNSMENI